MGIFSQFSVAREFLQRGDLEQALAEVDRVVGLFGKSLESLELQVEIRGAIVARNRSPEKEAEIWFDRGNQFIDAGDLENAIRCYDQVLHYKPDDYNAWNNRGSALLNSGHNEDAVESFDQALHHKPNDHDAWYSRGIALYILDRNEDAVESFDQALYYKSDDHEAWNNRGSALYDLGHHEDSIRSFDQALYYKPDKHEAWFNRGIVLDDLGRDEAALVSYDQVLRYKPDDHDAWNNRGGALYKLGRDEAAICSYDQALCHKLNDHNTWDNRGIAALSSRGISEPNMLTECHPSLNQRGYPGQLASLAIGLSYCSADTNPLGHGFLQRAIGDAVWANARTQPNPRIYWPEALIAYEASLRVLTATDHPEERLQTLQKLIRTHLVLNELPAARHYQTEGIALFQQLRATARDKRQFEAKFSNFSRTEIDLLIGENAAVKALEQAEFYKNRALTWILDKWQETTLSPSYREMRSLLRPDTAMTSGRSKTIVYWHLSDDALTTFILTPDRPAPIVLPTDCYQQSIDLKKLIDEYKQDYKTYRELPEDAKKDDHPWRINLQSRLDRLTQILAIGTIETHIGNAQQIILLPHRDLHLLPIHTGFADRLTCVYLPSIQIGLNLRESRAKHLEWDGSVGSQGDRPNAAPLLNIDDPTVAGQTPLVYSRLESAIVRALFDQPTYLNGNDATHTATIAALNQPHSIFHFSGHGSYDDHRPENSAIGLTDQNLTAKTIAALDLTAYDLINLAACETGITGKGSIVTEYVGLASAFLKARAGNVLSTLWQVDELSSTWLVVRFYQAYLAGEPVAEALLIAQTWLCTVTWAELAIWIEQLIQAYPQMDYRDRLIAHYANILENQGKLESTQPPFAAPYYWAGFRLMGPSPK
jgi:CHAT domain-containing protein/tetratricopeptide (TPR) repeat protein